MKQVERHYRELDQRLGVSHFLGADAYTVADIALYGWAASAGFVFGEKELGEYSNPLRFMEDMNARPAVARALALKQRYAFKAELDEQARNAMFSQNVTA